MLGLRSSRRVINLAGTVTRTARLTPVPTHPRPSLFRYCSSYHGLTAATSHICRPRSYGTTHSARSSSFSSAKSSPTPTTGTPSEAPEGAPSSAASSSSPHASSSSPSSGIALGSDRLPENDLTLEEKIEPRLMIQFTCTVPQCGTRSSHEFSKRSYEKGIVIVQCPGCKNRHLIADHLGWFKDITGDGKMRTIESIMNEKGELVKRGTVTNGVISIDPEQ